MIEFKLSAHSERPGSQTVEVFRDGKFVATITSNADDEDSIRLISGHDKGNVDIVHEKGPLSILVHSFKIIFRRH